MEYLREHVPTEVRMHGIITDGGKAANIVPDYACTQWYIRSSSRIRLDEVVARVKRRGSRCSFTGRRYDGMGRG